MIYAAAAGLILGVLLSTYIHRGEVKHLREENRIAHAQIAHAVISEGAQIPARIEPMPEPDPLSEKMQGIVNEWEEGSESRAITEHKIRGYLAEGYGEVAIARQFGAQG